MTSSPEGGGSQRLEATLSGSPALLFLSMAILFFFELSMAILLLLDGRWRMARLDAACRLAAGLDFDSTSFFSES
jgi:hypothetical protein